MRVTTKTIGGADRAGTRRALANRAYTRYAAPRAGKQFAESAVHRRERAIAIIINAALRVAPTRRPFFASRTETARSPKLFTQLRRHPLKNSRSLPSLETCNEEMTSDRRFAFRLYQIPTRFIKDRQSPGNTRGSSNLGSSLLLLLLLLSPFANMYNYVQGPGYYLVFNFKTAILLLSSESDYPPSNKKETM